MKFFQKISFLMMLTTTVFSPACLWGKHVPKDGEIAEISVCGVKTKLELALTEAAHGKGYMHREKGPEADDGMIFVFSDETPRVFWMANVNFALDILFVDSKGNVVSAQTMVQEPGVAPAFVKRYPSTLPARYAIEMRKGWFAERGLHLGCTVEIPKNLGQSSSP